MFKLVRVFDPGRSFRLLWPLKFDKVGKACRGQTP
jgi:hypothetical protein